MPMYKLIQHSDNYLKTSRGLWQYYRNEPALNAAGAIIELPDTDNNCASFRFKQNITGQTGNGTKHVEIKVPLKYLSNFWRALETPLINCEIKLILTCSANCFIISINICNN